LKQSRRDLAQGPPDSVMTLLPGKERKRDGLGRCKERWAMKLFTGWMLSAGLVLTAATANAQVVERYYGVERAPYSAASDVEGPTGAIPPDGPRYGLSLLAPSEVDSIIRESGFSPLGVPHLRGVVYTVSVLDRVGDDGRLVIDARSGRIISFMPANQFSDEMNQGLMETYGPSGPPLRPSVSAPRPPADIPHVVASRTPPAPLPKVSPRAGEAKPLAARPAPMARAQMPAAVPSKPADAQALMPAPVGSKPSAPVILPTQPLPEVQGLD
jgi:hypothetical protein